MATTKPYHPKVIKEIDLFIEVTRQNRPVITLFECVTLNRTVITQVTLNTVKPRFNFFEGTEKKNLRENAGLFFI
jgi:hypothetical protein